MAWQYITRAQVPSCSAPQFDDSAGVRSGVPIVTASSGAFFENFWLPASRTSYFVGCPSQSVPNITQVPPEVWISDRHGELDLNQRDENGRINIREDDGTIYQYTVSTGTNRFNIDYPEYFQTNGVVSVAQYASLTTSQRSLYCSTPVDGFHYSLQTVNSTIPYSSRERITASIYPANYVCPQPPPPAPPPQTAANFYSENPVSLINLWTYYALRLGVGLDRDNDLLPDFSDFAGVVFERLDPDTGQISTGVVPSSGIVLQDFYLTRPVGLGLGSPSGTLNLNSTTAAVFVGDTFNLRATASINWPGEQAAIAACGVANRNRFYRWEYRTSSAAPWQTVPGSPNCANTDSCVLSLTGVSLSQDGWQYRAILQLSNITTCTNFSGGSTVELVSPIFTLRVDQRPCAPINITGATINAQSRVIEQPGSIPVSGSIVLDQGSCGLPVESRIQWRAGNVISSGTDIVSEVTLNTNSTVATQNIFVDQRAFDVLRTNPNLDIPVEYEWTVRDSAGNNTRVTRSLRLTPGSSLGGYRIDFEPVGISPDNIYDLNDLNSPVGYRLVAVLNNGTIIDFSQPPTWWDEQHTYQIEWLGPGSVNAVRGAISNTEGASPIAGKLSGSIRINNDNESPQFGPAVPGDFIFLDINASVQQDTQALLTVRDRDGSLRGQVTFTVTPVCTPPRVTGWTLTSTANPIILVDENHPAVQTRYDATGIMGSCHGLDRVELYEEIEWFSTDSAFPAGSRRDDPDQGDDPTVTFNFPGSNVGPDQEWFYFNTVDFTNMSFWFLFLTGETTSGSFGFPPIKPGETRTYRLRRNLYVYDQSGVRAQATPSQWLEFRTTGNQVTPAPVLTSPQTQCPANNQMSRIISGNSNDRTFVSQVNVSNAVTPTLITTRQWINSDGAGGPLSEVGRRVMTPVATGLGGSTVYRVTENQVVPGNINPDLVGWRYLFVAEDYPAAGGTVRLDVGQCELFYPQIVLLPNGGIFSASSITPVGGARTEAWIMFNSDGTVSRQYGPDDNNSVLRVETVGRWTNEFNPTASDYQITLTSVNAQPFVTNSPSAQWGPTAINGRVDFDSELFVIADGRVNLNGIEQVGADVTWGLRLQHLPSGTTATATVSVTASSFSDG